MKQKTHILIWATILAVLTSCGFTITGRPVEGFITAINNDTVTVNLLHFKVRKSDTLAVGQWKTFTPTVKRKKINSRIIRKPQ